MTPEQKGPGQNQRADGEPESGPTSPPKSAAAPATFKKGPRFYAILIAICFVGMMTALEGTITSTALPSIVADLGGGDRYVWAVNGYFLAMYVPRPQPTPWFPVRRALTNKTTIRTALQPLQGQLANVFGRRWPTIVSTATFILGSGIGGGASNMSMLIAGRVIQGVGAGGINVLIEIIVCDLVPLRQRGQYIGMIFGVIALGTALGPLFGGLIVQRTTWRWVFYLNLPIGGVALVILILFLHVKYNQEKTFADKLTQIDWVGNLLFVATISAIVRLILTSFHSCSSHWALMAN